MKSRLSRTAILAAVVSASLFAPAAARAVILHPNDAGVPAGSRPSDNVVARVADNSSGVAIGPNHVLSVRHSAVGPGGTLVIGPTTYRIAEATPVGSADLQVFRIVNAATDQPANLAEFTPVYAASNEVGRPVVIGGYGKGRGSDRQVNSVTTGYNWDGAGNTVLRFGDNRLDNSQANFVAFEYTSDILGDDFDAPGSVGPGGATPHEAAITEFDSGSGWFLLDGAQWKVAGIGAYVERIGASDFGDGNAAVRLSSYAGQINAVVVPEPSTLASAGLVAVAALAGRRRRPRPGA